ncbi:MAG: hypothetical protein P8X98_00515 [Woeseiaceae bacterium]|jgi:hypothetical protein
MKPQIRSITGAVLMLALIPIFAGLLACIPVPIGDPERSSIDPDINGVWTASLDGEGAALYLFRPYDERTWLLIGTMLEEGADYVGEFPDIETHEDAIRALADQPIGGAGITAATAIVYKVWRTRLGGSWFMTWEPVGGINDDGSFTTDFWLVFRLEKSGDKEFRLRMVNAEHETFDDIVDPDEYEGDDYVKDMRRTWERALQRAIDDPELYADDEGVWVFRRVPPDLTGEAAELFQEVIEFD